MAVFRFSGTVREREDSYETGTVVADSEAEAKNKLKPFNLDDVRLKRLGVLSGMLKGFAADIK